jgi:hypothetical protein
LTYLRHLSGLLFEHFFFGILFQLKLLFFGLNDFLLPNAGLSAGVVGSLTLLLDPEDIDAGA